MSLTTSSITLSKHPVLCESPNTCYYRLSITCTNLLLHGVYDYGSFVVSNLSMHMICSLHTCWWYRVWGDNGECFHRNFLTISLYVCNYVIEIPFEKIDFWGQYVILQSSCMSITILCVGSCGFICKQTILKFAQKLILLKLHLKSINSNEQKWIKPGLQQPINNNRLYVGLGPWKLISWYLSM